MKSLGFAFLESLQMFGMKPGLKSTETLCNALGNPEKSFKVIHVVGTNGKGSTSCYLAGILQSHKKNIALYTSPHLISLQERLRINGIPVSEKELDEALLQVKQVAEKTKIQTTYFEALTVAAFLICRAKNVEILVAEAGLGGRLDATAVAKGEITVLTSVGLEHTAILGNSLESIMKEKLGIMSKGSSLVCFPLENSLVHVVDELKQNFDIKEITLCEGEIPELLNIGIHYRENARLAMTAAKAVLKNEFSKELAYEYLKKSFWPGRMQVLRDKNGKVRFILDGAHNSHAMKRLIQTLNETFPNKKFVTLFGVMQDKDLSEMLELMSNTVDTFVPSRTPYDRFLDSSLLCQELKEKGFNSINGGMLSKELLNRISALAGENPVLITGSLYLIGACIEILKDDFEELSFFKNLKPYENEKH